MERKIGEIFEYNGEWYQCVEHKSCEGCAFYRRCSYKDEFGNCSSRGRKDKESVIFKKLEKVGEPFTCNIHGDERLVWMQEYKLYDVNFCKENALLMYVSDYKHKRIAIEIKQNKEDMEEKKLNLKPFDIQKAKEGKPVCTRDGRKARIIAFDKKGFRAIVGLVDDGDKETLMLYDEAGRSIGDVSEFDLMMPLEKKEGWVNVYKSRIYDTEEEAIAKKIDDPNYGYIETRKIEWEE